MMYQMANTISDSVLRAAQKINKLLSEGGENYSLTPRQIDILLTLADESGLSQVDMMERCSMDRSTTSSVMKLMEKKGLITRIRSKTDIRAFVVDLTPQGKALVRQAKKLRSDVESTVSETVGTDTKFKNALLAIASLPLKPREKKKASKT